MKTDIVPDAKTPSTIPADPELQLPEDPYSATDHTAPSVTARDTEFYSAEEPVEPAEPVEPEASNSSCKNE